MPRFDIGQRVKDKRTGLTGTIVVYHGHAFHVVFDDDREASKHYASYVSTGIGNEYPFSIYESWEPITVMLPDTRDYLNILNGLEPLRTS